ncbi:hypothetical protein BN183_1510024 [Clostridioides difficile E7]|nr:hypothetical protein BN183_1510024 [Clostridioides difficile E7]
MLKDRVIGTWKANDVEAIVQLMIR